MNQDKIGKFISKLRKDKNMTQEQLAEKLDVTDKSISRWENGKTMPDSGIIPDLCKILGITINDLFHGKVVEDKESGDYLLEIYKQKEKSDRKLLNFEIIVGIATFTFSFLIIFIVAYFEEVNLIKENQSYIFIIPTIIFMIVMCAILLRIEQTAGYYECRKCYNRYVPSFKSVFFAMHINRTRYMKCPKCKKYSWNKKVISGGNNND